MARGRVLWFPALAGVYAIYGNGRLLYIGSTTNLDARLRFGHGFNAFTYGVRAACAWGRFRQIVVKFQTSRKYGDWLMLEARLLRRLRPAKNRKGIGKLRKATV